MILIALLMVQALHNQNPILGVWSVAETRNCEAGEAWVFTVDGYYVEVDLPSSQILAVGSYADQGGAIEYTHAHMPFPQAETPQERRVYKVTARTGDRIDALNYKGERRSFHRCPAGSLKAPPEAE